METIALIEWLDEDGQVRRMHPVKQWPVRLGRAMNNEVVIDNPHAAPYHAELTCDLQGVVLRVGQTINGVTLKSNQSALQHASQGEVLALHSGDVLQLGGETLRVRLPSEVLAPELALQTPRVHKAWRAPLLVVCWAAWLACVQWIDINPGAAWVDAFGTVLLAPVALVIWCAFWALLSKLFRGRFDMGAHLRIALPWVLGLSLLTPALHQLAFAFSWPSVSRISIWVEVGLSCALVALHLAWVFPRSSFRVASCIAAGFVAVSLFMGYSQYKTEKRWFRQLYSSTISLPSLRVAPLASVEQFLTTLKPLEAQLTAQAREPDEGADEALEDAEQGD